MKVGDILSLHGCITQDKYIKGRSLSEIEKIIGYNSGRLTKGMYVLEIMQLPRTSEFDLQGYSNVASHRFKSPGDLDLNKLKDIVRSKWTLIGNNRLVKVLPVVRHDDNMMPDLQYPPGLGTPQWVLNRFLPFRVTHLITNYPAGKYS